MSSASLLCKIIDEKNERKTPAISLEFQDF